MLVAVLVRASYKVATSQVVTLENIVGENLPLLFPEVQVMHRTPAANSLTISGEERNVFTNQPDSDFDGAVLTPLFTTFAVADGTTAVLTGLKNSLLPAAPYGITTEVTLTNAGPEAEAWVTLVVRGMIESSVSPDSFVTINV